MARAVLVAAVLLAAGVAAVQADEALNRGVLVLPPAYPAPPPDFVRLPSSGSPLILVAPGVRAEGPPAIPPPGAAHRPLWLPGRSEVILGLGRGGRVIQTLEYTSGRFVR
ncbi:MAG TPA: hypothetical protein VLD61_02005 [Methylomirabilota bacterium]|nr:hypothetical protein [Methylomirabilota bacterium]